MRDMRLCIGYALASPDRLDVPFGAIAWAELRRLDFELPDHEAFPCLNLAYEAGRSGQTAPAWLSAANEVAVEAFLSGRIAWTAIPDVIDATLQQWSGATASSVDDILTADGEARRVAFRVIDDRSATA